MPLGLPGPDVGGLLLGAHPGHDPVDAHLRGHGPGRGFLVAGEQDHLPAPVPHVRDGLGRVGPGRIGQGNQAHGLQPGLGFDRDHDHGLGFLLQAFQRGAQSGQIRALGFHPGGAAHPNPLPYGAGDDAPTGMGLEFLRGWIFHPLPCHHLHDGLAQGVFGEGFGCRGPAQHVLLGKARSWHHVTRGWPWVTVPVLSRAASVTSRNT